MLLVRAIALENLESQIEGMAPAHHVDGSGKMEGDSVILV